MASYYVRIDGINDEFLAFLGYELIGENAIFKRYRDYHGEEYIVERWRPALYVRDINDARVLAQKASEAVMIEAPPSKDAE